MTLHFRSDRPSKPRLVVLADVSGSMAEYSAFTLSLLEALRAELRSLRCFVFVDGAAELSAETLSQPYLHALRLPLLPGVVAGDGHSDYGAAFTRFAGIAGDALSPTTTLLVIGDGRTRGADDGEATFAVIARRVRSLYWLTPESEAEWASSGCNLERFRPHCDRVDQVVTLRQLERWVGRVVLSR